MIKKTRKTAQKSILKQNVNMGTTFVNSGRRKTTTMKTHLLLALSVLLSVAALAQDYDYKGLQLPNVQRHILRANLGPTFNSADGQSNGTLPLGINASGYINNRRDQFFYSGSTSIQLSGSRFNGSTARGMVPSLAGSFSYYKYNNNYFYVKPQFSTNVRRSWTNITTGSAEDKTALINNAYNAGFAVGKGRIDPIDWAIRAGFMNQNLRKSGAISRDLTESEWLELSREMAVIDRRRYFEGRFFNINRVKRVDSLFDKFGIVSDDPSFFTTVADQYFFAPQQALGNGSRFEVFATYSESNSLNLRNNTSTGGTITSQELINRSDQLRTGISYEYARPTNLHWHHRVRAEASIHSTSGYSYEEQDDIVINEIDIDPASVVGSRLSYSLNWIPSTRTWLQWTVENTTNFVEDDVSSNLSMTADFNYFVSRRMQYSASLTALNSLSDNTDPLIIFSAGFNYQIW